MDNNNYNLNNQNMGNLDTDSSIVQSQFGLQSQPNPQNIISPTPTPTQKPIKKIIIILIIALLAISGIITAAVLLTKKPTPPAEEFEFDYDEFEQAESALREYEDSILSDPIFSITPYTDPDNIYTIRAWFINEDIIIGIMPACDQTQNSNYVEFAKNYLTSKLGEDLSKYTIQIQSCQE